MTCTTATNGALDPTFGAAGKVSNLLPPAKVLRYNPSPSSAVGGMTLSRYNADSTDTTFGTNGSVTIVASGGPLDDMDALAVQADGNHRVAVGLHSQRVHLVQRAATGHDGYATVGAERGIGRTIGVVPRQGHPTDRQQLAVGL